MVVDMGKFLIDLGFRNILNTYITWIGSILAYGHLFCCSTTRGSQNVLRNPLLTENER